MSYKGFKKIGQDEKTTTFRHPNGSELRVAHQHLTPALKNQLDGLPMHMADGGPSSSASSAGGGGDDDDSPSQSQAPVTINIGAPQGGSAPFTDTPSAGLSSQQSPPEKPATLGTPDSDLLKVGSNPAPAAPQDAPPAQPQNAAPAVSPPPASPAPQVQTLPPKPQGSYITQPMSAPEIMQQANAQFLETKQKFQSGEIRPETYQDLFNKKDTLGKIGTLFGLLVGGAGSGLTGQPNAVLEMMNKQIENDLEAKKATKGNQLNFMQAADNHVRALSEASLQGTQKGLIGAQTEEAKANAALARQNMAKGGIYLSVLQDLTNHVSKIPPGPQRQAAEGALQVVNNGIDANMAQSHAQMGQQMEANWGRRNAALNMVMPEIAKFEAERHIPYVGDATEPADEKKRDAITKINNFQNLLNEASDRQGHLGRIGALSPAQRARGEQLHNDLVSSYNDVKGLNRFTGNEEQLYDKVVPGFDFTHSITGSNKALLDRLKTSVAQKKQLEYDSIGLQENQASASAQKSVENQPSGPVSKKGRPVVEIGGKLYYKKAQ